MAFKVIQIVLITALIAGTLTEAPVMIDEQQLRVPASGGSGNGWQDSVPGLPGKDYPNLTSIPKTSFSCTGKTPGGYYADVETRCQVFHVCNTEGTKSSFLCPSGSIFSQRHLVCDWWYDFECERAPDLYSLNDALDDHESTSDRSESDDRHSPNAPLPYNSIGASNNDLSLASSGYPNNIRDEAHLTYEHNESGKTIEADGNSIPEEAASGAAADSAGNYRKYVAGAVASPLSSFDNHSDGQPRESADPGRSYAREQHRSADHQRPTSDARSRNSHEHRSNYRGRPSPLTDNVPRGFSNSPAEDLERNDRGPGIFVNNGLSEERDKNEENTNASLRESSNLIDNQYSNNNVNNVRYGIYYQNAEKYPLPRENNNYENNNGNNKEIKENNYYYSNGQYSSSIRDFAGEPYSRILEYAATTSRAISSAPTEDEVDREWQRVVDSTELKRNSAQRSSLIMNRARRFSQGRRLAVLGTLEDLTTSSSGPEGGGYLNYDTSTFSRPEESTTPTSKERPKRPEFLGRRPTGGRLSGAGNGLPGANKELAAAKSRE